MDGDNPETIVDSSKNEIERISGSLFIKSYMSKVNYVQNASSALFARRAFLNIDNSYMNYKGAGDRLFWIYLAEQGDISIINAKLNYFRQHPNNSTKKYYLKGINQKEDKKILDYIRSKGYLNDFEYFVRCIQYGYRRIIWNDFESKEIKSEVMHIWNISTFRLLLIYLYDLYVKFRTNLSAI